jgi:hypothetical protein
MASDWELAKQNKFMPKAYRFFSAILTSLMIIMALAGCGSSDPKSLDFQVTARSKDAVLTMFVIPRDAKGNIINRNALLTVKLWDKPSTTVSAKGNVIGHWDDLPLSDVNFMSGRGILVSLAPNALFAGKSGHQAYIQLIWNSDGKSLSTPGIVILGDLPPCCANK